VRNVNDKNGQLQKQLDNVIREANGEMNLLNNKKAELERDLELERRKVRELQETARERDKEYQKLKIQLDKIKRKTLFGPTNENGHGQALFPPNQFLDKARSHAVNINSVNNVDLTAVVGGMEANGVLIKAFEVVDSLLMSSTDPEDATHGSYWWSNLHEQYEQPSASQR